MHQNRWLRVNQTVGIVLRLSLWRLDNVIACSDANDIPWDWLRANPFIALLIFLYGIFIVWWGVNLIIEDLRRFWRFFTGLFRAPWNNWSWFSQNAPRRYVPIFEVHNYRSAPLNIVFEPWADEYLLDCDKTLCVECEPTAPGPLQLGAHEDVLCLFGKSGATMKASVDGKLVWESYCPCP